MSDNESPAIDPNDPFAWGNESADPTELNSMITAKAYRWTNRLTSLLLGLALVTAGAAGGAWYQEQYGGAAASSALASQFAALRASAQTGTVPGTTTGAPGTASATSDELSGKVALVDTKNNKLYVTLTDGTSKVITLGDETDVISAKPADITKLKAGQQVTVSTTTSGGVTTATTVAMEQS